MTPGRRTHSFAVSRTGQALALAQHNPPRGFMSLMSDRLHTWPDAREGRSRWETCF